MLSNVSKKLACLMFAGAMLVGTLSVEAATDGYNGNYVLKVKTKANWYKAGQEAITLNTREMSRGAGARGIYKVYLDGKYYGQLGNPNASTYDWGNLKVLLKRNKTHTITIKYDLAATKAYYKKKAKRNMPSNIRPYWRVSSTHKVENYW